MRLFRNVDPLLEFSHSTSGGPENDARGAEAGKRGDGQLLMNHGDLFRGRKDHFIWRIAG